MPVTDADELLKNLDTLVLAPMPAHERELMKGWAAREMVEKPIVTLVTKKVWVDAYEDEQTHQKVPGGHRSLNWRMGHSSPQNPEAIIFAMMIVDVVNVHVFSFANVKTDDDKETVIWFKEIIHEPETTFGPVTGEALFLDWALLLQDEDEHAEFMEERAKVMEKASARAPNGGAS